MARRKSSTENHAAARRELAFEQKFIASRLQSRRRFTVFKWTSLAILVLLLVDLFLLPEQYKISDSWAWSWALAAFVLSGVVLLTSVELSKGRRGWRRWTVVLSAASAVLLVLFLSQIIRSHHIYILIGIVLVGFVTFTWLSKRLSPIDRE